MKKTVFYAAGLLLVLALAAGGWRFWQPGHEKLPAEQAAKPAAQPAVSAEAERAAGIPVLMYHSVGTEPDNDAVISPELFTAHMEYLQQHGFTPLAAEELEAYLAGTLKLPPRPVVITFDDGYRDTYEVALPVLKRLGLKSILFIPAGEVGRRLSWQELREMKAAGMQIASHSFSHRELGALSAGEQAEEIVRSKELLDGFLEQDTRFFCYPYGSYNQDTLRLLREHGFKLAVTLEPGWVKSGDNPLKLRRVWMGNSVTLQHLHERLTRADYPML